MSHFKQREGRNCLNCNARVNQKYCGECGQENIEPKETVWHLVKHFFEDITHFDGKFFSSLKHLFTKPGFLSEEYIRGRRMAYLNPIRFYIFTSFIVFFFLFKFIYPDSTIKATASKINFNNNSNKEKDSTVGKVFDSIQKANPNNNLIEEISKDLNDEEDNVEKKDKESKSNPFGIRISKDTVFFNFGFAKDSFLSVKQFDSLNNLKQVNHNWLLKKVMRKIVLVNESFGINATEMNQKLMLSFIHSLPQALFISLPFFALILKLLYWRRKQFYYVSHFIFTLHLYIFIFINILAIHFLNKISALWDIDLFKSISILLIFFIPLYVFLSLRYFYNQSWIKTFFKMNLLGFILLFFFMVFFILFIFAFSLSSI